MRKKVTSNKPTEGMIMFNISQLKYFLKSTANAENE